MLIYKGKNFSNFILTLLPYGYEGLEREGVLMNKKVLNATTTTAQNFNEQNKQKTKTLIVNLGTATQLTLGNSGTVHEGRHRYLWY
jgi:hypothetical protein